MMKRNLLMQFGALMISGTWIPDPDGSPNHISKYSNYFC